MVFEGSSPSASTKNISRSGGMVDTAALEAVALTGVRVRVSPSVP